MVAAFAEEIQIALAVLHDWKVSVHVPYHRVFGYMDALVTISVFGLADWPQHYWE